MLEPYEGKLSRTVLRRVGASNRSFLFGERKIEAFIMLWTLVFSFGAHLPRNIANMKRKYEKASRKEIAESSWYMRFRDEWWA